MAKGLAASGSSDLGRIGGGSNAGLIPCNEKKIYEIKKMAPHVYIGM